MEEKYENALEFNINDFASPLQYPISWIGELKKELYGQEKDVGKLLDIVYNSKNIFTYASGISDIACILLGTRLKQMGYEIYHSADHFKPPIKEDDALFWYLFSSSILQSI